VTDYLFNPDKPAGLNPNPQYFSYNQWGVSQPLLRGYGVDVTMAPIKIACAQAERTDWQFKQEMLAMVRSIETTYWSLYAEQQNLKAIEAAIPSFREVVRLRQEQATGAVGTESEVARAQSDMYLFEQRRLETMSRIAEQQLVLRNLMGLPPDDCRDIVLLAVPTTTRPTETLPCAVQRAINSRPDVLRQRLAVYIASQERLVADNALLPQLDLNGFWQTNGLGENLDQSFESKDSNDFESWQMGVFFQMPLGRRQGRAELRAAELRMSRERAMLQQTAHQASYEVVDAYRRLNWAYQQLEIAANREQALNQWSQGARATFENPPPGVTTVFALEMYLGNLRDMTDATFAKNALLADYNSALARLAEVTGSLLENRMIEVAGDASGTLPSRLPPAEIQLPDSVAPTPVQPVPQPAPQGDPQGMIGVPSTEIVGEPQPLPQTMALPAVEQPGIEMPDSMKAPEAYAELPVTPAPQAMSMPMSAPMGAPVEIAEQSPSSVPQPLPMPAIEMPQSAMPDPAHLAARPAPMEAPVIEAPFVAEKMVEAAPLQQPMVAAPMAPAPVIEEPQIERPRREVAREVPRRYTPVESGSSIAMPKSTLPNSPDASGWAQAETGMAAERIARRTPGPIRPMPQGARQMPTSVMAAPQQRTQQVDVVRELPPTAEPARAALLQLPSSLRPHEMSALRKAPSTPASGSPVNKATAAPLQLPASIRPGEVSSAPAAMPAPQPVKQAPRNQAGPLLQMPNSVRPASAEARVVQAPVVVSQTAPPQPAAALKMPNSVGSVVR
jgi:outer membrane protein TolC